MKQYDLKGKFHFNTACYIKYVFSTYVFDNYIWVPQHFEKYFFSEKYIWVPHIKNYVHRSKVRKNYS